MLHIAGGLEIQEEKEGVESNQRTSNEAEGAWSAVKDALAKLLVLLINMALTCNTKQICTYTNNHAIITLNLRSLIP